MQAQPASGNPSDFLEELFSRSLSGCNGSAGCQCPPPRWHPWGQPASGRRPDPAPFWRKGNAFGRRLLIMQTTRKKAVPSRRRCGDPRDVKIKRPTADSAMKWARNERRRAAKLSWRDSEKQSPPVNKDTAVVSRVADP